MNLNLPQNKKGISLRTFITLTVSMIVVIVLLVCTFFYYNKTSVILHNNSQQNITQQLEQVNTLINEQIDSIDSVIPLFLANNLILTTLESPQPKDTAENKKFQIERQMSHTYHSTSLSGKNFTDSIYLISDNGTVFHTYTSGKQESISQKSQELIEAINKTDTKLMCIALPSDSDSIYFCRNLFHGSTGQHMGIMALKIDTDKWISYCAKGLNPSWFISLYNNKNISILSDDTLKKENEDLQMQLKKQNRNFSFQEMKLNNKFYYVASETLSEIGFTSVVAAPKDLLLKDLNSTLKSYLLLLGATIVIALLVAVIISRAITRPIEKMVFHINEISRGKQNLLPPMKMYQEFNLWTDSFNQMLKKLDLYYNDIFQKQLLLKNAEIQALQSQMNPHFLFNVLNTIAWKAQMIDNEEIYQMVISLGELLKMNTLSKDRAFVELEKEMQYVRFYIYLQQMRFEDKISCTIQIPQNLLSCQIPCFCIQPLVENAIVHGIEPKKGKGKLAIQILEVPDSQLEIRIIDNGVGFSKIPDLRHIDSSPIDEHTHIALRNLNKRLELLFGENAQLHISSTPNVCTSISFFIPLKREDFI